MRRRIRKGLAVLLTATMVVGLMPGAGTIKVSAAEGEASGNEATAEGYDANGFCTSYELTNGTWALKSGATACATHGETCNGYQPAVEELLDYDINGDGNVDTDDKAYEITNAGQLYWFADKINNDYENYKDKNAVLTKDITVNEGVLSNGELNTENESTFRSWTPIGYQDSSGTKCSYKGIFDGAGNTITGLYFDNPSKGAVGFFCLNSGTIKNVCIDDSFIHGSSNIGGVCAYNDTGGNIETCNNNGFINGENVFIGGVCGYNGGTITNCENTGNVFGSDCVGGVCGCNDGLVKNCSNKGNVKAPNSGAFGGVGGVCGYFDSGSLETSYNTGDVQGSSNVGGICGEVYSSAPSIKNCYYKTKEDNSLAAIGKDGGGYKIYVEGKTSEQFSNGVVAYLLNSRSGEDSPVWYQNIDNGATPDTAPVLDSSHGTVCASLPCKKEFSNEAKTVEHTFQGYRCTVCGELQPPQLNAAGAYEIKNANDLIWFAELVNGTLLVDRDPLADAVLVADITFEAEQNFTAIGSSSSPYSGTFDGAGFTVTVNQKGSDEVALFGCIGDCTIKNLTVTGTITTSAKYAAGIAMQVLNNTTATIEKCMSNVTIDSAIDGDGTHGGLVGVVDGTLNINNACFTGKMTGSTTNSCGGMVGYSSNRVTIKNSYVAADFSSIGSENGNTFARGNVTLVNCYYLNEMNATPSGAVLKTADEFANGYVTNLLNGRMSDGSLGWYQNIDNSGERDSYPVVDNTHGIVYSASQPCTCKFSNVLSEPEKIEHEFSNDVCTKCGKTKDAYDDVELIKPSQDSSGVYQIGSAGELYWFSALVNGKLTDGTRQNTNADAVLTNNITVNTQLLNDNLTLINSVESYKRWAPIGNESSQYIGTFDGKGYTISGLYNKNAGSYNGLFGYISGAMIKNVNIIDSYFYDYEDKFMGILCGYSTMSTIENVLVKKSYVYGSDYIGGVCGRGSKTINNVGSLNCSIKGAGFCGDIVGYSMYATISNSFTTSSSCVCGWNNYGTITNCYYLAEADDQNGGKASTQFASGEVAYLLNGGKSGDDVVWRQNLGEANGDATPVLDSSHGIVYLGEPCQVYTNASHKEHKYVISEDGKLHTCSDCDTTEQHADVATFTVNNENHSITATCPSCGNLGTITLSASDATYDGADKAASISGEIKGFDTSSIVYKKKAENGSFETINTTPKDAGTYRASITYTVDEANNKVYSVSVTYDISPATPTLTWPSEKTVGYTGNAITEDAIGEPTVTLVNEESYNGTIQYSYRTSGSSDEFTSGLPTERGTYEVKASVDATENYMQAEKSMTLTIAWLSDVADATLTDQGGKSLTGDDWWAQSVTFTPPEGYTICGTVDGTYGDSYTYDTETAEAGTDVTYYLKNKTTGEIAQKSATVRVDTTAPDWSGENDGISIKTNKWKSLLSTISFGLFYKETVDVTVSASDSLSGVAKYYYYVDTSAGETVKTKEELDAIQIGENGFIECDVTNANATQNITSLSDDKNYVVYVYAVDAVGNKSDYICSNGVVIDKTSPIISNISTPSKGSGEDATLTDTKADMTFTASESGTYFYIVKKSSEDAPAAINDFADSSVDSNTGMTVWKANESVTADAMTADDSNRLSLTGLTANTAYTVYVIGVDRAGNASDVLSKKFTTCKTMPEVTTNPTLSGTYGDTVSSMTLQGGEAKADDTVIDGTWTLTDGDASDVPSVGATKSYEVTFTPDEKYNGQYDTVLVSVIPTVEHKAVTVTAENKSKTYGQENPELTFTVPDGSLVGSDTVEALGVTLSCEATKDSPVKEGGYAITGTSSSANYKVTVTPGILTINQASAEITVGTESYSKTFGEEAFDLSVTDNNTDEGADVTYAVSDSKNAAGTSVDNEKVITVDASGKVTIVGAGSATITASLAASNNFTAATSKTITVTVAKKTGYTVSDIQESYLYSKDTDESIDLSKYIPDDCGTVAYGTPQTTGDLYAEGKAPAITDSKLTYTVKQAEAFGATGTITVTVSSDNYADFDITVSLKLIDKIPVKLQSGSSVSLVSNTLTYGKALSTLTFNKAVFVDGDGTVVPGTLDWTDRTMKPALAVTSAAWKFTPENSDYATVEGNLTIKVEKAEPNVTGVPTVADRIYHPNAKLADTDLILTEASVLDVNGQKLSGTWNWKTADVIPTVNNSGYEAVFTPDDTDNYKTITKTITVNVTKATPYIETAPTAAAITYGKTLADATLTGGSVQYSSEDDTAVAGTFAWEVDTTKPAVTDSNTTAYKVVFTPENKNYNTVEKEITVTVSKADAAPNKPDTTMNVDYGKEKVSDITTLPEGWAWKDADKDTALTVGTAVKATAVYTGADKGNYETESVEISITRAECTHATTEVKNAKDATCTEKGYTGDTYCKDCGVKLADGTEIAMTDHKWDSGKVTKEPTETAEGVKTYTCSVCGRTKTEAIPKKEAATPQPPKKGDVVKDDKTSVKVEVSDVKKKEVEYKEPVNKKAKTVSIPATVKINGVTYKVTKIADNAFKNNKTVTKVTVGSNIKTIGKNAFYKCTKLKTVKIGKNVTTIESNAFKGCSSLTSVTLPSKATKIGANAFNGCKKLKTIKITSTKLTSKTVSKNAFKGLTKATTIKVPKKKLSAYKKLFKQKGLSSKVKVKGY